MKSDPTTRENREALRTNTRIPVKVEADDYAGLGVIVDLSTTGALLAELRRPLGPGSRVAIHYPVPCRERAMVFEAVVVRETADGFAVRFDPLEADAAGRQDRSKPE